MRISVRASVQGKMPTKAAHESPDARRPHVRRPARWRPPLLDRAEVGARLRQVRKAQHMTLKQLSALSGVPVSTLSKMELAQVSVSYENWLPPPAP